MSSDEARKAVEATRLAEQIASDLEGLKGNQTVPKDNSPRSFIAIHERCEVVEARELVKSACIFAPPTVADHQRVRAQAREVEPNRHDGGGALRPGYPRVGLG